MAIRTLDKHGIRGPAFVPNYPILIPGCEFYQRPLHSLGMDGRRVLYVGAVGEATASRIMSLRAAGMEVDTVTASDGALARATEVKSQVVVVDMSSDAREARKVARAFGDDKATRGLPLVLIGVSPSEMTITRSKVPKARAMFVSGASPGEVAAVVARVPIVTPKPARSTKAKKPRTSSKRKAAAKAPKRSKGSARTSVRE